MIIQKNFTGVLYYAVDVSYGYFDSGGDFQRKR